MAAYIWNLALFALVVPALAIPTHNETVDLIKRTITGVRAANCAGRSHSSARVRAAAQEAADHRFAGTVVSSVSSDYPHRYSNFEGFTFAAGCNAPFFEFPLPTSGIYTGGKPGPDRVIIGSVSRTAADAAFCGVITHTGAPGTTFRACAII